MPKNDATSFERSPDETRNLMDAASAAVIFAPAEKFARPLATLSALLSATVPRNKWSGRTQIGLSQRWQTNIPPGMGPLWISQDKRWALT